MRRLSSAANVEGAQALRSDVPCVEAGLVSLNNVKACEEAGYHFSVESSIMAVEDGPDACRFEDSEVAQSANDTANEAGGVLRFLCSESKHEFGVVAFERVSNRTCVDANMEAIDSEDICKEAADEFGLNSSEKMVIDEGSASELACYYKTSVEKPFLVLSSAPDPHAIHLCLRPLAPPGQGEVQAEPEEREEEGSERSGSEICKGITYSSAAGRCEVWLHSIDSAVEEEGSICLRYDEA